MKKYIILVLIMMCSVVSAQNTHKIIGTVKDQKGQPVAGAVVMLEGTTSVGTMTDVDGNYSLSISGGVSKGMRLEVSCLGYKKETVEIANKSLVNFVLLEDTEQLEEIVVVGYGAMRRSDLTGSVTSVKLDETETGQSTSIDQLLQGRAAGVQVFSNSAAPDAGVSIQIRGASSFNSSSDPLYVVDGIIMNTSGTSSLMTNSGTDNTGADESTNGLMGINPQDIASIEVLKDASATAIYGSQAANGVILITTKTAKSGKPVVNVSAGVDISLPTKKMPMMSFDQYVGFLQEIVSSPIVSQYDPALATTAQTRLNIINSSSFHERYEIHDWQDYLMRSAISQRYFISISGKPGETNYRVSLGINDADGIILGTGFSNFTLRVNLEQKLGKIFTLGTKSNLSYLRSDLTQGASTGRLLASTSMMRSMLTTVPYGSILEYDDDGDIVDEEDDTNQTGPMRWVQGFENKKIEYRVNPSVYLQAKITDWLSVKSLFGADFRLTDQSKFKSQLLTSDAKRSSGATTNINRLNWNWDNTVEINKRIDWRQNISGTVGMSMSSSATTTQTQEGTNIDEWKSLGQSLNSAPYGYFVYSHSASTLLSFFARAIYNYGERYVLTATFRADGSSKFAQNNRWGYFPSFAFAWRINQEKWFNAPLISMAKLRLGWGQVGNQAIGSYATIYNYSSGYYPDHDSDAHKTLITYTTNLPNPDLKWETTDQTNIGFDYGMFQGRLTISVDAYYKKTKDLLQKRILSGSSGMSDPYVNMGSIENKGLEITIDATPVKVGNFEWSIGGNISLNRNKVLSINPDGTDRDYMYLAPGNHQYVSYFYGDKIGSSSICNAPVNIFVEGQPMGLFYGMSTNGLVQEGNVGKPYSSSDISYRGPGSIDYIDVNKDGFITAEDRTIIGDPNPDFTYGFNTSLRYKNFIFAASFVGAYGNDIYNVNKMIDTNISSVTTNSYSDVVTNAWSPKNTDTWYPILGGLNSNDLRWASDRYIEDGSYLRISSLSLTYNLALKKKKHALKGLSITGTVGNPWVWTKYSGWDPDVNSYGTIKRLGVDMGSYPADRMFKIDVKCTF